MNKNKISKKEILFRLLLTLLVVVYAYFTKDADNRVASSVGFFIALGLSTYLHRHFAPFIILSCLFYLMASTQELWNEDYIHLNITKFLWIAGNLCIPLGILDFWYRITFKYKIVTNGSN